MTVPPFSRPTDSAPAISTFLDLQGDELTAALERVPAASFLRLRGRVERSLRYQQPGSAEKTRLVALAAAIEARRRVLRDAGAFDTEGSQTRAKKIIRPDRWVA